MRACVLNSEGLRFTDDYAKPTLVKDETLVRVNLAGICSTDLELVKGYFGFSGVIGHEFVGTVEQSSDASWVGKRVVSTINFADPCTPEFAEFGLEHHPKRSVLGILNHDGAMADFVRVPTRNLLQVPDAVDDETAVFTEPLAAALRIAEQTTIAPSNRTCVIGPGRLGMLIGKVLAIGGTNTVMLGRRQQSLDLAKRWQMPTELVDDAIDDTFDLVVEATGSPHGLEHALRLVKPLGTLVLKSTYAGGCDVDLTKIVVGEINVIGSRCGPFAPALRLLERGAVDVKSMIDGRYAIEDVLPAMEHAAQSGTRKILLSFDRE